MSLTIMIECETEELDELLTGYECKMRCHPSNVNVDVDAWSRIGRGPTR